MNQSCGITNQYDSLELVWIKIILKNKNIQWSQLTGKDIEINWSKSVATGFTSCKASWYIHFANDDSVLLAGLLALSLVSSHCNHMLMSSESAVEQHNELNASKASRGRIKRTASQSTLEWGGPYEQLCITHTVIVNGCYICVSKYYIFYTNRLFIILTFSLSHTRNIRVSG